MSYCNNRFARFIFVYLLIYLFIIQDNAGIFSYREQHAESVRLWSFPDKNKSRKGLPLETKNTQNHENRRFGFSLFICNTVVCEAAYAP